MQVVHAPSIRRLCTRGYCYLTGMPLPCPACCSDADVGALNQLTCLTHLDLRRQEYSSRDAHLPELVQQLREALPMCQVLA